MPARDGTAKIKDKENIYDPDELIFALDIGTRTVIGIVGIQEAEDFKIISVEILEHKSRVMFDGQIHDIDSVAEVVRQVKEKLEKEIGVPLVKVAIAAAGRVLNTCKVKLEKDVDDSREIDYNLIGALEIEAIQNAQKKLDEETTGGDNNRLYCVGYSVVNYFLNGYVMTSLVGHKGNKIGVEILATFLPRVVVDSLYTVMKRVGLEVSSLTLEPIAAINVAIPKSLRQLNLALVDVGAGTSDIALTRDGSVVAYAMTPIAGDEITEEICRQYLVDFNTGEKMKLFLTTKKDSITFTDIMGNKRKVTKDEVGNIVQPVVKLLADTISQKIIEYNNKSPNAVFLVGGGSQVPWLAKLIAENLGLPEERVAVRGRNIIQNLKVSGKKLSGPDSITPVGIAVTAQMQRGNNFFTVTVNGKEVKLFNAKMLKVADALMFSGFNPDQLIGKRGKSLRFKLNGDSRVIRGEHGKAAEIFVNNEIANIDTFIMPGDNIIVKPAKDGKDAEVYVYDIAKELTALNMQQRGIETDIRVYINNVPVSKNEKICDGDAVHIEFIPLSGTNTDQDTNTDSDTSDKKTDLLEKITVNEDLSVNENFPKEDSQEPKLSNEKPPKDNNGISVVVNGKTILLGNKEQYIFVDIFNYIDFDLTKPKGNIVLKLNGRQAAFTDIIKNGDIIEINWDKR
ncbi:MAG TPA: cell division protein FtsA [Clostridiaceae bacterium]|nr:cell division protein FtsA [Clostridiaceae bacterium]